MAFSFFGGIHPRENKWYACDKETQVFPPPDNLVISLAQHTGAPCTPLVKVGDWVAMGQKIGDGPDIPVHASVSGKVIAVEPRPQAVGGEAISVVIENDRLNILCEDCKARTQEEVDALRPKALIRIIREGGIVGMGGAALPTHAKFRDGMGKVNTVIVNACECEPYVTADDRLCREHPQQIIAGLKLVMKIFGLTQGHIAMEDNKPEAADALNAALSKDDGILLDILPARYPQGGEKQLLYAITGREVPSGGLPADVGCAVFNAATIKAIYDVVYQGLPLIQRIVTVSGDIVSEPKNLLVPIGTSFEALIRFCSCSQLPYKILSGGPMMGTAQSDGNVPTVKGVNAVTVLGRGNGYPGDHFQCLRCGKCVDVCPMRLMPIRMYRAYVSRNVQEMAECSITDCIECGCCAYTCPAGIPLVQGFRMAKQCMAQDTAEKEGKFHE